MLPFASPQVKLFSKNQEALFDRNVTNTKECIIKCFVINKLLLPRLFTVVFIIQK